MVKTPTVLIYETLVLNTYIFFETIIQKLFQNETKCVFVILYVINETYYKLPTLENIDDIHRYKIISLICGNRFTLTKHNLIYSIDELLQIATNTMLYCLHLPGTSY